jgi:serine kinase of HPr protein (carbohydrate metabolism regulator)
MSAETIHATAVAIDGRTVLITGPSGAGKSDLALRLIDRGAILVSDDYIMVRQSAGLVLAEPPAAIAGLIEVRGLGIVAMPHVSQLPVALVVRLEHAVERMPEQGLTRSIAGIETPEVVIDPREPSAPIKVELALRRLLDALS